MTLIPTSGLVIWQYSPSQVIPSSTIIMMTKRPYSRCTEELSLQAADTMGIPTFGLHTAIKITKFTFIPSGMSDLAIGESRRARPSQRHRQLLTACTFICPWWYKHLNLQTFRILNRIGTVSQVPG